MFGGRKIKNGRWHVKKIPPKPAILRNQHTYANLVFAQFGGARPAAITRMKRCIAATGLALLLVPPASARTRAAQEQREQSLLARITVYWASGGRGSDSNTRQHKSSTGVRLRVGHCAVDPHRIPYGSKVVLTDGVFTAVDTGGALISRKAARRSGRTASERNALVIDRFFETKRQALSWANAHPAFMTVQVIPPNCDRTGTAQSAQVSRQPALPVTARTVPQTKRIASAGPDRGFYTVRR